MGMACNKVSLSDMNLSKTPSPSDLPSQLGEDVKMIWLQVFWFFFAFNRTQMCFSCCSLLYLRRCEDSKCWGK